MGLRINTNIMSINAQKNLRLNGATLAQSEERLSSGYRINKSADDAAGLAISENLNGQVRSYAQAGRNAQDGISFIQVAEGGMAEVSNMLIRLRELGVQAASDTVGDQERGFLNVEAQQLKNEIERTSQVTQYNGQSLLNGQGDKLDFQIGIKNDEFGDRISYDPSGTNVSLDSLGISGVDVSNKSGAQDTLGMIDVAVGTVNSNRANLGALQSRLTSTMNNIEVANENLSAAKSRIRDVDVAVESSELAKNSVKTQAATSVLAQANNSSALALKLIG